MLWVIGPDPLARDADAVHVPPPPVDGLSQACDLLVKALRRRQPESQKKSSHWLSLKKNEKNVSEERQFCFFCFRLSYYKKKNLENINCPKNILDEWRMAPPSQEGGPYGISEPFPFVSTKIIG